MNSNRNNSGFSGFCNTVLINVVANSLKLTSRQV